MVCDFLREKEAQLSKANKNVNVVFKRKYKLISGISSLTFSTKSIWTPDVVCSNEIFVMYNKQWKYFPVNVTSDGLALWMPGGLLTAICPMHMKYCPFDTQTCDLKFGVWSSEITS